MDFYGNEKRKKSFTHTHTHLRLYSTRVTNTSLYTNLPLLPRPWSFPQMAPCLVPTLLICTLMNLPLSYECTSQQPVDRCSQKSADKWRSQSTREARGKVGHAVFFLKVLELVCTHLQQETVSLLLCKILRAHSESILLELVSTQGANSL